MMSLYLSDLPISKPPDPLSPEPWLLHYALSIQRLLLASSDAERRGDKVSHRECLKVARAITVPLDRQVRFTPQQRELYEAIPALPDSTEDLGPIVQAMWAFSKVVLDPEDSE